MKDVSGKQFAPFIHRNAKVRGDMAANTLGSLQEKKAPANFKNGHFRWTPAKVHVHEWVTGTDNKVCVHCGLTEPKDKSI